MNNAFNKRPKVISTDRLQLAGKRVLLRVDFNVPITTNGTIKDNTRILQSIPTINFLLQNGANVILLSHFGRPAESDETDLSLEFVVPELTRLLKTDVGFCSDIRHAGLTLDSGFEVILLENTRFHQGEKLGSVDLAKQYAEIGHLFVLDAFSIAHRKHASSYSLAKILPSLAGFALEKELNELNRLILKPRPPFTAIVGGSKISTKISLLSALVERLDHLIIAGAMANTFLSASGTYMGRSLIEPDCLEQATEIVQLAKSNRCTIYLPEDGLFATSIGSDVKVVSKSIKDILPGEMMLDIGPNSVSKIADILSNSSTMVWNGPLGAFETQPFDSGTNAVGAIVGDLTEHNKLLSIAGGGDTASALNSCGGLESFSFVSTGGGAFLEWLENSDLPGLSVLTGSLRGQSL